jgi:uncharacterized protein
MLNDKLFKIVENYAYKQSEKDDLHGFDHVKRVYNNCITIGKELSANMLVLKISALLHDIGRIKEKDDPLERNHADISADLALDFLSSNPFNISKEEIYNIKHSIEAHSFSNNIVPKTLEAKILSDADKLDALGAIGLYRTIGVTIKRGKGLEQVIEHLENKILKLKEQMNLAITERLAKERQKIILDFYYKIKKELEKS